MFCRNSSGRPVDRQVLVARQRGHGVARGAEAVHEDQRQRGVVLLAQVQHLPGDDVEEGQPAAHAQQRLGAVHAHRRAEAAVELDHRGRRGSPPRRPRRTPRRRRATPCRAARSATRGSSRSRRARAAGSSARTSRSPTASTPAGDHLVARAVQACATHALDRRLAAWPHRNRPGDSTPGSGAAKLALRDQLADRPQPAAAGRGRRRAGAAIAEHLLATRRYAARRPSRRTSRSAPSRAPGSLLDALVGGRQAGDPAGAAARRRPRLGGVRTARARWRPPAAGCSSRPAPRSGVDAVATADVVLVPGLAVVARRACGSAAAAAATTGRWRRVPVGTFTCVLLYDDEVGRDVPAEPHDRPVARPRRRPAGISSLSPGPG